jgi:ribulose-phosphate 3-epimerase
LKSPQMAPSILSADMGHLADEIRAVEKAGADMIHVDVMDGHFVPNLGMGPAIVRSVREYTDLPIDVHLMIEDPLQYLEMFIEAGATMVSFHAEACHAPLRIADRIRSLGAKAGIVINPATPASVLDEVLGSVDYVLTLCVEPGFGNQAFRYPVLDKIRSLRLKMAELGIDVPIQVDGGVNAETIGDASEAGAEIFIIGSAVFDADEPGEALARLRNLASDRHQ